MKKKFGGGFYPLIKVSSPVRKTSGFRTARTFKICRTSGLDVMSGRALENTMQYLSFEQKLLQIFFWSHLHYRKSSGVEW